MLTIHEQIKCTISNSFQFGVTNTVPASNHYVAVYLSLLMYSNPSVSKMNMAAYSTFWAHEIAAFSYPCKSTLVRLVKEGVIRKCSKLTVAKESLTSENIQNII